MHVRRQSKERERCILERLERPVALERLGQQLDATRGDPVVGQATDRVGGRPRLRTSR